jgi:hypothetical protein
MNVEWIKCGTEWCPFQTVDLSKVQAVGVYAIWHAANAMAGVPARYVRIGQGDVKERIAKHRSDPDITRYAPFGLWVTWAAVPQGLLNGVENYLADKLDPLVGERFPNVVPIQVNLPA